MLGDGDQPIYPIQVRLDGRDQARVDALARMLPGGKRAAVARLLLLRGLADVERDPALLLRGDAPAPLPAPLALGPTLGEVA